MIEQKAANFSSDDSGYFLKEDDNAKVIKKPKKKETSGTDFNEYGYNLITRIQLFFACISLVLIPISLFPLEWVMFEYGRSLVLIVFTIVILTFELIKFFIRGRLEIYRSSRDMVLLILALSFLISHFFSSDPLISFWGYEYRFGTGLISIVTILIYVLVLKAMVKDIKDVVSLVFCLTLGILISALLSIVSFYGFNPFGFLPGYEKFFLEGLPLFNSARLSVVVWSVGIFLSFFVFHYFFRLFSDNESYLNKRLSLSKAFAKKRAIQSSLLLVFAFFVLVFVTAISLFTIKNLLWVGAVSLLGVFITFLILALVCRTKVLQVSCIVVLFITFSVFAISRLPVAQNILSIDTENLVEQVSLDADSIWNITVSSLSESSFRSLVGLGNDNFIVAYNLYRPAFSGDVDLNFINYSYANNEVYNVVANRGFIGIFVWLVAGFLIISQFVKYLKDETRKKMIVTGSTEDVGIILLDLILIFIWLFSLVSYYGFTLYFILFLLLGLSSLFKNVACKMYSEALVVQTNFFVEGIGSVRNESLPKFFIIFVSVLSVLVLFQVNNNLSSKVHALRAESMMYELNDENKEEILQRSIDNYILAIERNPRNYVFRRKVAIVTMEYVNRVLAEEYVNLTDDEQRQEFIRVVGVSAEASLEEARQATELAPMVAVNWSTRDLIYSELVKLGFQNYINTALKVSEQAILREPNNYNPYVNRATYLYLLGDVEGAISYARRSLEINPYYVPGLVLAGEISMALQDYINAQTYFQNAKIVLGEMDLSRPGVLALYEQVENSLAYLWSLEVDGVEPAFDGEVEFEFDETEEYMDIDMDTEINIEDMFLDADGIPDLVTPDDEISD